MEANLADAISILDKALDAERGLRLTFDRRRDATSFRHRIYRVRQQNREDSKSIYEVGHPKYGASAYDSLIIRMSEGEDGVWLIQLMKPTHPHGSVLIEEL